MRKDRKSSYQAKKDKLHCIKYLLETNMQIYNYIKQGVITTEQLTRMRSMEDLINDIWEIVKDE